MDLSQRALNREGPCPKYCTLQTYEKLFFRIASFRNFGRKPKNLAGNRKIFKRVGSEA